MRRRDFLQTLAAVPLAASVPAFATAPRNRLLVLVYLHGGNDGYNTWVPYTDKLYYKLRPNIAVARDAVLKVTGTHGFHPSLAPLAPLYAQGEIAMLQGIGLPEITQQHYRDTEMAFTASDLGEFHEQGWVSRALSRRAPDPAATAEAVAFDVLDIREADPLGPFRGNRIRAVQVHHAHQFLARHRFADCVKDANEPFKASLARRGDVLTAQVLKTNFPRDPFGDAVRAAVHLAAADRAIPVIHLGINGIDEDKHHSFDNHWDQLKHHGGALKRMAEGLAALREGLREIGRWDDTLVLTYDEFGRSPVENDQQGTHHGLATTHFAMGGRVKGGPHGVAPPVQNLHEIGGPPPVIDSRRLWTTVVESWWGEDAKGLFARRFTPLDLLRA